MLISSQIFCADRPASMPSELSITDALAAGLGRQVIRSSTASAMLRGLSPARAPASSRGVAAPGSRSKTVSSNPARRRLPASFDPTLPRPMNPTDLISLTRLTSPGHTRILQEVSDYAGNALSAAQHPQARADKRRGEQGQRRRG